MTTNNRIMMGIQKSALILKATEKKIMKGCYTFLTSSPISNIIDIEFPNLMVTEDCNSNLCRSLDRVGIDAIIEYNTSTRYGISHRVHKERRSPGSSVVTKRPGVRETEMDRLIKYYGQSSIDDMMIRAELNVQTCLEDDLPTHTIITSNKLLYYLIRDHDRILKEDVFEDGSRIFVGKKFMDDHKFPYEIITYTAEERRNIHDVITLWKCGGNPWTH